MIKDTFWGVTSASWWSDKALLYLPLKLQVGHLQSNKVSSAQRLPEWSTHREVGILDRVGRAGWWEGRGRDGVLTHSLVPTWAPAHVVVVEDLGCTPTLCQHIPPPPHRGGALRPRWLGHSRDPPPQSSSHQFPQSQWHPLPTGTSMCKWQRSEKIKPCTVSPRAGKQNYQPAELFGSTRYLNDKAVHFLKCAGRRTIHQVPRIAKFTCQHRKKMTSLQKPTPKSRKTDSNDSEFKVMVNEETQWGTRKLRKWARESN